MDNIVQKLKSIKHQGINPDEKWLENNRNFLLSQISNTTEKNSKAKINSERMWQMMSIFLPRNLVYGVVRPVAVMIMVLSVGTSGWIATVGASQNSLPGEILYTTKRATEKTHIAVVAAVGARETETIMRVGFAKRRAEESKELVRSKDPKKIQKVEKTISDLEDEIKKVEENLNVAKGEKDLPANIIRDVSETTSEIGTILKDVEKDLIDAVSTTPFAAGEVANVVKAKNNAKEASVKAVQVMVGKHLEGDKTVNTQEVKEAIQEKVEEMSKDTKSNVEVIGTIKVKTAEAVLAVNAEALEFANSTTTTDTSKIAGDKVKKMDTDTDKVVVKVGDIEKQLSDDVDQTSELLKSGDIRQAMEVVMEAGKKVSEVNKTTEESLASLKEMSTEVVVKVIKTIEEEKKLEASSTPAQVNTDDKTVEEQNTDSNDVDVSNTEESKIQ